MTNDPHPQVHAAVGLQLAPAMEQLLVTLADVQSEDLADVLGPHGHFLAKKNGLEPTNMVIHAGKTWGITGITCIMEYPETCGFSPSGKFRCWEHDDISPHISQRLESIFKI